MKTQGAVFRQSPGKWEILELDVDSPRQGELILKMAGLGDRGPRGVVIPPRVWTVPVVCVRSPKPVRHGGEHHERQPA